MPAIQNLQLSPHVFNKMSKLQFVYFRKNFDVFPLLPRGLQSFPAELRYLSWSHYPLISLPENFSAENLVIFDLSGSLVLKLWDGVQVKNMSSFYNLLLFKGLQNYNLSSSVMSSFVLFCNRT